MSSGEKELEVKFYLDKLADLEHRLGALGAVLVQARTFELNLRFDTVNHALTLAGRVLRLRQDAQAVMTYKGPGQMQEGVGVRQEIEFTVSDLTAARHLLEALGYQVAATYEKYRSTYLLDGQKITLDELPYGDFVEVEGSEPSAIRAAAEKCGLAWDDRVVDSYLGIFTRYRVSQGKTMPDLTFKAFEGIHVTAPELGVKPADQVMGS